MSALYDLTIDAGTSWSTTLTAATPGALPIDLTGATVTAELRQAYEDPEPAARFAVTIADARNGQLVLALDAPASAALGSGQYLYDVLIVGAGGQPARAMRLLEGVVTIRPRVTRGGV